MATSENRIVSGQDTSAADSTGAAGADPGTSAEKATSPGEELLDEGEAPRGRRSIRLVRPPTRDGIGVFCVTAGEETTYYTLCEVPCDIGGRGFAVHRLGLGQLYHVRVGRREDCSCECLGFLAHGRCKHVAGLLALVRSGQL